VVVLSQANAGLVRRDLLDDAQAAMRASLDGFSMAQLQEISFRAAESFVNDTLPAGEDAQSPEDYVRQLSATTGLPHVLVRRNMEKIQGVLARVDEVLAGLTRNLDLEVLDRGLGESQGHALSFVPRSPTLGVVLPPTRPGCTRCGCPRWR
jgi:hypothetical protein